MEQGEHFLMLPLLGCSFEKMKKRPVQIKGSPQVQLFRRPKWDPAKVQVPKQQPPYAHSHYVLDEAHRHERPEGVIHCLERCRSLLIRSWVGAAVRQHMTLMVTPSMHIHSQRS